MKYKYLLLLLLVGVACGQHEDIPYQSVEKICDTCECLRKDDHGLHFALNCVTKNFEHILARWPQEFGTQHTGVEIAASFSGNKIRLLQQLPATTASVIFSCRHCSLQQLQAPLFMDVPNVEALYLSWNEISDDALKPDLFRGPFNSSKYEPIALKDLDLSHNRIARLDRKLFEHTPLLRKLSLGHNRLSVLDAATTAAIASLVNLQRLDLSHNGLFTLPTDLFPQLRNLYSLDISGNEFAVVPPVIQQLKQSLLQLNLAQNPLAKLDTHSLRHLGSLRRLNISEMPQLRRIDALLLPSLEQLECARNPKLEHLEFMDLLNSRNLTQLDLSQNALTTLTLNLTGSNNSINATWPRLRSLAIAGNPWYCSCDLLRALEQAGAPQVLQPLDMVARCDTPYLLAGAPVSNLTAEQICNMVIPKKYRVVEDDPPRFLRRRYIILTVIIASVVVVAGLIIGFIVVCVRRRLKGSDYGIQPIRYTSVRGSNLSAFSQLQPVSVTSKFNNAAANAAGASSSGAPNA